MKVDSFTVYFPDGSREIFEKHDEVKYGPIDELKGDPIKDCEVIWPSEDNVSGLTECFTRRRSGKIECFINMPFKYVWDPKEVKPE